MASHPIDIELQQLRADSVAAERLAVIWAAYTNATGKELNDPPTEMQRKSVYEWVRSFPDDSPARSRPYYAVLRPQLIYDAADSPADKAAQLGQWTCPTCRVVEDANAAFGHKFHIQVTPWSAQSVGSKKNGAIKDAVHKMLKAQWAGRVPTAGQPMCVAITALVARKTRTKDADNLVKGLLDSLSELTWANDAQIQCLTSRRVEYGGTEGLYLVNYRAVEPWSADSIWDSPATPKLAWGERVVV